MVYYDLINNSVNRKTELEHIGEYFCKPSTASLWQCYLKYPLWVFTSLNPCDLVHRHRWIYDPGQSKNIQATVLSSDEACDLDNKN